MTAKPKGQLCTATTATGSACRFAGWNGRTLCVSHASKDGDADAKAEMANRGRRGRERAMEQLEGAKLTSVSLRSTGDHLTQLEQTYVEVSRSGGDIIARAKIRTEIIKVASALLKTEVIETELQSLKDLISTHLPHLKKHLKAVP